MTRMFSKILAAGLCCTATLGLTASITHAANPFAKMFVQVEADPHKDYAITEKNGPWMISAYVFSGENAEKQAKALVYELRKEHKLNAFTYVHEIDHSQVWNGKHIDKYGQTEKMRNEHNEKLTQVAVMVGNYASSEDTDAQETREMLKKLQPLCLSGAVKSNDPLASGIEDHRQAVNQLKKLGPMSKAFLCTNPMIKKEYFQTAGLDKLVLEMNSEGENNLLNCPGKFSVRVATFRGGSMLSRKNTNTGRKKETMSGKLQEAGDKAELLCQSLREKGYEAWVFHDRTESMVTVGSFYDVGTKRKDGKTEMDPRINKIMEIFGPRGDKVGKIIPGEKPTNLIPKKLEVSYGGEMKNVYFDMQPIPIQVPKRGIGAAYQQASR